MTPTRRLAAVLVFSGVLACGGGGERGDLDPGNAGGDTGDLPGEASQDLEPGETDPAILDLPVPDAALDPSATDGVPDPLAEDLVLGDSESEMDAEPPTWDPGLPSTEALGSRRGYRVARMILHMHNVFSHDACDNQPRMPDGSPNEECHQQMREALCTDRVDFAMMTDHSAFVVDTEPFEDLYMSRAGDTWEEDDDLHSANVVHCQNGHEVRITVGMEGGEREVSPIALRRHPVEGDRIERAAAYADASPEGVRRLRDAGAIPVIIHIEDRPDAWLDAVDADLFEICNLHILLAPNIRERVGLDPQAAASAFLDWLANPDRHAPAPDLVFLEFHQRVPFYMDQWDRQLQRRMLGGFAGNDVHQNVLALPLSDGERPDSYRRMMKWYVNHLLVLNRTARAAREALEARRLYQVFEVLGTPADFDFWAAGGDGTAYEMGAVVPEGAGAVIRAPVPTVLGVPPGTDPVRMVLIRVTPDGVETAYDGPGPVEVASPAPGRYRLEVFLTPRHLEPWLQKHDPGLIREYPWIYANPIEIR